MSDAAILFRSALQSAFGYLDWLPVGDGEIHRFQVPGDKPNRLNGWYVLFPNSIASGAFGSWKIGSTNIWRSREPTSQHEAEQVRQRIEQVKRHRQAERQQRQRLTSEVAQRLWSNACKADPGHEYLATKGVPSYGLRQRGSHLLIPLYSAGQLVNLQCISLDGSKRFLSGGQVRGSYSPLGMIDADLPLCICEGWATGATLHQNGYTVAAAMNAGNLKPVALALRARHPNLQLIIAGDDDQQTDGNPGRTFANAAAAAAGAEVAFPEWPTNAPPTLTDYNDLAGWSKANGIA